VKTASPKVVTENVRNAASVTYNSKRQKHNCHQLNKQMQKSQGQIIRPVFSRFHTQSQVSFQVNTVSDLYAAMEQSKISDQSKEEMEKMDTESVHKTAKKMRKMIVEKAT